jgi:hypothetical protein
MAGADDVTKNGELGQDVKFHTKISTTTKKNAVPKQNPFYDLEAFTPKEVSLERPPPKNVRG